VTDSDMSLKPETREANPYLPEVAADPVPFYDRLRRTCPVARFDGMGDGMHILSRYEDVRFALRHPEVFTSESEVVSIGQDRPLIPLQIDPPAHAKYRRLIDPHLSPRQVERLADDVRRLVNELIDGFIDRGSCNFHTEFSVPLPSTVFLRLLGAPVTERDRLLGWKDNIIRPGGGFLGAEEAAAVREQTGVEMYAYLNELIDERTEEPRDDLISMFVASEIDGEVLTSEEILDILYLFVLGGLDTVTSTLDCSVAFLAAHPDHRAQLAGDLTLVDRAVEELLRHQTPVMQVLREVRQPAEMHGVALEAGDYVMIMLGAANTDGDEFDDAAEVRFDRDSNRHLAFGGGPHRCLGSHLARLELRVALEELHRRIPSYRLADGAEPAFSPGIREVAELPLVFPPGAVA
jgi:cytochrome P450